MWPDDHHRRVTQCWLNVPDMQVQDCSGAAGMRPERPVRNLGSDGNTASAEIG